MAKPKKKLSKVAVVGVTTHTMCFNCYCHQQNGAIKPYQRLAERRRAIRYRSRSGLPFKYRSETLHVNDRIETHHDVVKKLYYNRWFNELLFYVLLLIENRATAQAQDR